MGPSILMPTAPKTQKQQFLPGILSRRDRMVHRDERARRRAPTSPRSRTAAVRDGDEFVIDGQKIWTSFGETADYCYLICRTSTEGPPHAGISELIVPLDSPGITISPIKDMTTNRHFCEVFYENVRVPAANIVGEEGGSWKQTMRQLEHERGGIDRLLSNFALYQVARRDADTSDPIIRQKIATLEIGIQDRPPPRAPRGDGAGTEVVLGRDEDVLHRARAASGRLRRARSSGPNAMVWGRLAQGFSYSPAYTIMGGTSNVLRNIIGERVLGLPREP